MIEHRLIEKMLQLVEKEIKNINTNNRVDTIFLDTVVDFIRSYADRTHHGKEEDIMFKALENKNVSNMHLNMMSELIAEHTHARKIVGELVEANQTYLHGDLKSMETIKATLTFLTKFYPEHIRKEDHLFFPQTETYFTGDELDHMLLAFWEFDRKMIHEKYKKLYEFLATRS
jgi:hemerythrin-like domain-containing protein